MTEQAKRTPIPWKVVQDDLNEPWKVDICTDRDDECVMIANVRAAPPVGDECANAEFIVRAVNSHESLLEACKAIETVIGPWITDKSSEPMRTAYGNLVAAIAEAERPR